MLVIPVYDTLILSNVQIHVQEEVFSAAEIENIKNEDTFLIVPIREQKERGSLCADDFYEIGILAQASSVTNADGNLLFQVETGERVRIQDVFVQEDRVDASYEIVVDENDLSPEEAESCLREFKQYAEALVKDVPGNAVIRSYIRRWKTMHEAATNIGGYLALDAEERFAILAENSLKKRYHLLLESIRQMLSIRSVNEEIKNKMTKEQQDAYKVAAIRKQMKYLEEELQELDDENLSEAELFAKKIEAAGMPEEARREADRVLHRFEMEGSSGHEYGTLYDYLDFVTTLSWKEEPEMPLDLAKARKVLDKEHYGLDKVKKRVLEQLAVTSLKGRQTGSILLFTGAPGTGKTSMGHSIAEAMGRKYVRISLGGIRDEAEIRGHRRTYVGAMAGRIMEGIRRAGVSNPVMVLDEIDKLASEIHGDPASALLEVLDPEQNVSFVDHYLNVPYDLSKVFFICTANSTESIPKPLMDRMEVISLSGYTPVEKYHIARKHLLPKAVKDAGLKKGQVAIQQKALKTIIDEYTMEAGVRGLKKQLDKICRYAAVQLLEQEQEKVVVTEQNLHDILGKKHLHHDEALKKTMPGVATGLAWTQAGGEILFIETLFTKGSGKIQITGQLGDVMKESAEIAFTLAKAVYANQKKDFDKTDIHIHVPEGATPKDGPSAGITLFTALSSLILEKPVKKQLAMTGELSLRGEVLPIGGLPEKLMAAQRAGVKTVLIPQKNVEDLEEIPEEIRKKLTIIPVGKIQEVARESLGVELP
ncbi:MAG: endopeptidase La [Clostridiaceae bacterium]|nr:endopeptidase La [Clostridiaceae bacterium]